MSPAATGRRPRAARRPRRALRLVVLIAAALVAFLYYRPLRSYLDTRHALTDRRGEVRDLQAQKRRLERRLAASTSPAALELEARRLALVKPGERLFIVKGIAAWEKRGAANDAGASSAGRR